MIWRQEKRGINLDEFAGCRQSNRPHQLRNFTRRFGYGSSSKFYSDEAIEAQSQGYKRHSKYKRLSYLFGRCADYVLREHPNTLNVFCILHMKRE